MDILKISAALNGSMLRAETSDGSRLFMKSVMEGPYDEIRITNAIHTVMKDRFGDVLFVDEERRFMLMRDYGTPIVKADFYLSCDGDTARDVLRQWVEVQKDSVAVVEELCKSGVRMHVGTTLRAELEAVACDAD